MPSTRGTHALRKRCPSCKKLRRFYQTPQGATHNRPTSPEARGWYKVDGRWTCPFCRLGSLARSTLGA